MASSSNKDVTAALPAQGAIDQREEKEIDKVGDTSDIGKRGDHRD
jgi:hypothetical protein